MPSQRCLRDASDGQIVRSLSPIRDRRLPTRNALQLRQRGRFCPLFSAHFFLCSLVLRRSHVMTLSNVVGPLSMSGPQRINGVETSPCCEKYASSNASVRLFVHGYGYASPDVWVYCVASSACIRLFCARSVKVLLPYEAQRRGIL